MKSKNNTHSVVVRVAALLLLALPLTAQALIAINSTAMQYYDPGTDTRLSGVLANVTQSGGGGENNDWQSTSYTWSKTGETDVTGCVDSPNDTGISGTEDISVGIPYPPLDNGAWTLSITNIYSDVSCGGTSWNQSAANIGSFEPTDNNPNVPQQCGLNLILIMDESGSIDGTTGATQAVRDATNAFIDALDGTGARVGVVEFSTHAQQVIPQPPAGGEFPPPGGGQSGVACGTDLDPWNPPEFSNGTPKGQPAGLTSGTPNTPLPVVNAASQASIFDPYIGSGVVVGTGYPTAAGPTGGDNYNPDSTSSVETDCDSVSHIGNYTNWDYSLEVTRRMQTALISGSEVTADAVIFFTDGVPNRWLNATPNVEGPTSGSGALNFTAVNEALTTSDAIKQLVSNTTKVISLGVGQAFDNELAINALKAVSGPDTITSGADWEADTDTILVANFSDLGDNIRDFVLAQCSNSISIQKEFDPDGYGEGGGSMPPTAKPDWQFETEVVMDRSGAGAPLETCDGGISTDDQYFWDAPVGGTGTGGTVPGYAGTIGTQILAQTGMAGEAVTYQWKPGATSDTAPDNEALPCGSLVRFREPSTTAGDTTTNGGEKDPNSFGFVSATCTRSQTSGDTDLTVILNPHCFGPGPFTGTQCGGTTGPKFGDFLVTPQAGDPQLDLTTALTDSLYVFLDDKISCSVLNDPGDVPVTLSSFRGSLTGDEINFEWITSSESNSMGFNLWAQLDDGQSLQLNDEMIESSVGASLSLRNYSHSVSGISSRLHAPIATISIESLDMDGSTEMHGPYQLEEAYGDQSAPREIAWQDIRREMSEQLSVKGYKLLASGQAVRDPAAAVQGTAIKATAAPGATVYDLRVREEGMYRVKYEDLVSAGIDLAGVPNKDIAITSGGEAWPRHVKYTTDRLFGAGSEITFYATGPSDEQQLSADFRAYQLLVDGSLARNQKNVLTQKEDITNAQLTKSYEDTLYREENNIYDMAMPNGDPWYDRYLFAHGSPTSYDFTLAVDKVVAGTPATLYIDVAGMNDYPLSQYQDSGDPEKRDHHLKVYLNGSSAPVWEGWSEGLNSWQIEIPLSAGDLDGSQEATVKLELPGDTGYPADIVFVNKIGVKFHRTLNARKSKLLFDGVSGAVSYSVRGFRKASIFAYAWDQGELVKFSKFRRIKQPNGSYTVKFKGVESPTARYWVSSGYQLMKPEIVMSEDATDLMALEGDLLIITNPLFIDTIENSGYLDAKRADGFTPQVIDVNKVYAAFGGGMPLPEAINAYLKEAVASFDVSHVILVGAPSSDPADYTGAGSINFMPTRYVKSGNRISFAPNDGLIFDLDGDGAPDIANGRLPARTVSDLENMLAKSMAFKDSGLGRDASALLLADETDSISFSTQADAMAMRLVKPVVDGQPAEPWDSIEKVYMDDYDPVGTAIDDLVAGVNQGVSTLLYSGHGSTSNWGGLFNWGMIDRFTNDGMPTLISTMACYTTYIVSPSADTLGHNMLAGANGAVAVHGSTVLSGYTANGVMLSSVLRAMLEDGNTLGEAIMLTKQSLVDHSTLSGPVKTWQLLGDPTLRYDSTLTGGN